MQARKITAWQVRIAKKIARWYFQYHHGHHMINGSQEMYCSAHLNHFSVSREAFAAGSADTLFKVLVATVAHQAMSDRNVRTIMRKIDAQTAYELTSNEKLRELIAASPCEFNKTIRLLSNSKAGCTMGNPAGKLQPNKKGSCSRRLSCYLHEHTEALGRYSYFGKIPTGIALALQEQNFSDLSDLRAHAVAQAATPQEASMLLERYLMKGYRIGEKIANMFLSVVCNPRLGAAPWQEGVDPAYFVVIDVNVQKCMAKLGFKFSTSNYGKGRAWLCQLAHKIDMRAYSPLMPRYEPRMLQQAMYLFMSSNNRAVNQAFDCRSPEACRACPRDLKWICPIGL